MKRIDRFYFPVFMAGIVFLCLICASSASAEGENPCSGDISKFCKDVKHGAVMDCLEEHENELSAACKAHEAKMGGKKAEMREEVRLMKIVREACKEDTAKFCKDVAPETGGIEKCLNEHKSELSGACRTGLNDLEAEREKEKK